MDKRYSHALWKLPFNPNDKRSRESRNPHFYGEGAAVHIIAIEQIRPLFRGLAVEGENVAQVVELPVGVPTHRQRHRVVGRAI